MNASKLFFSDDASFKVLSVDSRADEFRIYVQSKSRSALCPNCCIASKRVHSYYTRQIADLPILRKSSAIFLRSRKFYCHQEECPFKIFTERFEHHFKPYSRKTDRLKNKIRDIGLLAGGKPAERLCAVVSIPISDTTILRLIKKDSFLPSEGVIAVGVDDWAYKKRNSYGSILVNLHTGKVIDLLPDREEATLREWLEGRPEIEVVTRDRYSKYKNAITSGAPQATQVTDRWHLMNMGRRTVKRYLDLETLPRRSQSRENPLERFFPYIKKRMEEAPDILLTTLWDGLKSQGYNGAYSTLSGALHYYGIRVGKKAGLTRTPPTQAGTFFKPSTAAIWFVSDQTTLNQASRNTLSELCIISEEMMESFKLAQCFREMMIKRSGDKKLRAWIDRSITSGIKEIASFAKGILADYPAVENAFTLPWSNGPVEGNVNRLKTIKRQMYGRAGFDLLRRRVVYTPS